MNLFQRKWICYVLVPDMTSPMLQYTHVYTFFLYIGAKRPSVHGFKAC